MGNVLEEPTSPIVNIIQSLSAFCKKNHTGLQAGVYQKNQRTSGSFSR